MCTWITDILDELHVILYMLKQVSENRYNEWKKEINDIILEYSNYPQVAQILQNIAGLKNILWSENKLISLYL